MQTNEERSFKVGASCEITGVQLKRGRRDASACFEGSACERSLILQTNECDGGALEKYLLFTGWRADVEVLGSDELLARVVAKQN